MYSKSLSDVAAYLCDIATLQWVAHADAQHLYADADIKFNSALA